MTRFLARLADLAYRRRGRMVLAWIAATIVIIGVGSSLAGEYEADYDTPGSESKAASDLTEERFDGYSGQEIYVVWKDEAGADSPAARERVDAFFAEAEQVDHVAEHTPIRVSRGRHDRLDHAPADRPRLGGPEGGRREADRRRRGEQRRRARDQARRGPDLRRRRRRRSPEGLGFLGAAIVLLIAFGSVVAAGLPLVIALVGLGISSGGLIVLLANVVDVPDWTTAVSGLIGIGVGIDYSLLVLTRFRAAMNDGKDRHDAVVEAVTTAGRSVIIAGATVVIAVLGLALTGLPYMYGVAISASFAVLVVMLAAVTLLPALLSYLGPKVDRLRIPFLGRHAEGGGRRRVARGALEPRGPAAALDRRDRRHRGAARAGGARARHAPRLPRRRQRPAGHHDPPGLRPEHGGIRPGHQRAAGDRRRSARDPSAKADDRLLRGAAAQRARGRLRRPTPDQRRRATRRSSP